MKLEMDFPVTNNCVKWFNHTFCNWGQKKTTYNKEGQIKGKNIYKILLYIIGGTAPLWVNPSPTFYKVFFILTLKY